MNAAQTKIKCGTLLETKFSRGGKKNKLRIAAQISEAVCIAHIEVKIQKKKSFG